MHILETIEALLERFPAEASPIQIHKMFRNFDAFDMIEDVA